MLVVGKCLAVNFFLVLIWLVKLLATSLTESTPTGNGLWILRCLTNRSAFQFLKSLPFSPLADLSVSVEWFSPLTGLPVDVELSPSAHLCVVVELLAPPIAGVESISPLAVSSAGVELLSPLAVLAANVECLTFGSVCLNHANDGGCTLKHIYCLGGGSHVAAKRLFSQSFVFI